MKRTPRGARKRLAALADLADLPSFSAIVAHCRPARATVGGPGEEGRPAKKATGEKKRRPKRR